MGLTTTSNTVNPVLFADAVQNAVSSHNAFIGSGLVAAGVVVVNPRLQDGKSKLGTQVEVPYFDSMGEFEDVADGVALTARTMGQTYELATVIRAGLMFDVTKWARDSAAGPDNMYSQGAEQVLTAAQRRIDKMAIDAATASANLPLVDVYSASVPRKIDYDLIADGIGMWDDGEGEASALIMHSAAFIDALKLKDGAGRPLITPPALGSTAYKMLDIPIIKSNRLPYELGAMSAVTSAGTSPPTLTLAGTPTRKIALRFRITLAGARGTFKYQYSIDGGVNWSAEATSSGSTLAVVDPLDKNTVTGDTGITFAWANAAAALDNTYSASSSGKYTSLLCKPGAIGVWFDGAALALQTQHEISTDSDKGAIHLYGTAHRYRRLTGSAKPGIVALKHN